MRVDPIDPASETQPIRIIGIKGLDEGMGAHVNRCLLIEPILIP